MGFLWTACTFLLSSRKAIHRTPTLIPPLKQRLHKSQLLQKLNGQKPFWDQVRLSSLEKTSKLSCSLPLGFITVWDLHQQRKFAFLIVL